MPSVPIPPWLTGTAVTAVVITPLIVANDGTFTLGTTTSLTGHLDEMILEQANETENIVPLDSRLANEVIVSSGTSLTLIEILARTAGNFLAAIGNAADYVQVSFSRGGRSFTAAFVVRGYQETIRRGKCVGALRLAPCGVPVTYA